MNVNAAAGPNVKERDLSLYGGEDPRELPRYTYAEAARATAVPATTIAAWFRGQSYARRRDRGFFRPVLARPDRNDTRLSFVNLLEVHVLRALRHVHSVRLETVRKAIEQAQRVHGIPRLLLSNQLRTSGGQLFLDSYFQLETLSPVDQMALRGILRPYLERVHIDEQLLVEFCPLSRIPQKGSLELISVSPFVAFGRAVVRRTGVSTHAVAERIALGESKEGVMADYGLNEDEFAEAILYERASDSVAA